MPNDHFTEDLKNYAGLCPKSNHKFSTCVWAGDVYVHVCNYIWWLTMEPRAVRR